MELLGNFPDIKPNIQKNIKSKTNNYDVCFAIPKGKKFFGWFTYYFEQPVFFLVDIIKKNIYFKYTSFDVSLCNTIIYGTQLYHKSQETFCIEDVLIFQSKPVYFFSLKNKLPLLEYIFKNLHCNQIGRKFLMFGYPFYSKKYETLYNDKTIPYVIYCYQFRKLHILSPYLNYKPEQCSVDSVIFCVEADNRQDIYKLSCKGGFYDYACVSTIKISKLMNSLFRNIKESNNLDLLEESDDDEEFENMNEGRYNLNKKIYMKCRFNKKFKLWEPLQVSKKTTLLTSEEIKNLEI